MFSCIASKTRYQPLVCSLAAKLAGKWMWCTCLFLYLSCHGEAASNLQASGLLTYASDYTDWLKLQKGCTDWTKLQSWSKFAEIGWNCVNSYEFLERANNVFYVYTVYIIMFKVIISFPLMVLGKLWPPAPVTNICPSHPMNPVKKLHYHIWLWCVINDVALLNNP